MADRGCAGRLISALLLFVLAVALSTAVHADELTRHVLGTKPICRTHHQPVLIISDLTVTGEIDDSITLYIYRQLELLGCIRVLGVVSIFGNGGSGTAAIHRNLAARLPLLGGSHWPLLHGPDERLTTVLNRRKETVEDHERLSAIAAVITDAGQPVVIAELGPATVSARLLSAGYVQPIRIAKILAVGGRMSGESFTTNKRLGRLFSFRDMNVAEDVWAMDYLVHYHFRKLWLVTYRSGLGKRMVTASMIAGALPALT
ncbi:MAG: hypothetical protein KC592_07450, partial [Nitrospira sp.]|nr:hypothetical protein [Nitrospira sp.]